MLVTPPNHRARRGQMMSFELREWRALAIGWAAAVAWAIGFGADWRMPMIAIGSAMIVWALWSD
jgi:hypothetical protein